MERNDDTWQARLPFEMQTWVIWPQRVEAFHDNDVPASKWRGYDLLGELCYYRHSYTLWDEIFDDEEPYQRLVLSESLEAWRTLDGRWIRRVQRTEAPGRCGGGTHDSGFELVQAQAIPRF